MGEIAGVPGSTSVDDRAPVSKPLLGAAYSLREIRVVGSLLPQLG